MQGLRSRDGNGLSMSRAVTVARPGHVSDVSRSVDGFRKAAKSHVNQLSNSALIGSWLRIAFKGRPDERGEFTQLKSEIQIRGLVEPHNGTAGEEMVRDLNTATNLGNPVPSEYLRPQTVEVSEVSAPALSTLVGCAPR